MLNYGKEGHDQGAVILPAKVWKWEYTCMCVGSNDEFAETRVCIEKSWEIQLADWKGLSQILH